MVGAEFRELYALRILTVVNKEKNKKTVSHIRARYE
jgi:hypothetical protein